MQPRRQRGACPGELRARLLSKVSPLAQRGRDLGMPPSPERAAGEAGVLCDLAQPIDEEPLAAHPPAAHHPQREGERGAALPHGGRPLLKGLVLLLVVQPEQRRAQDRLVGHAAAGGLEVLQVGEPPGEHATRQLARLPAAHRSAHDGPPRRVAAPRVVGAVEVMADEMAQHAPRPQHGLERDRRPFHPAAQRACQRPLCEHQHRAAQQRPLRCHSPPRGQRARDPVVAKEGERATHRAARCPAIARILPPRRECAAQVALKHARERVALRVRQRRGPRPLSHRAGKRGRRPPPRRRREPPSGVALLEAVGHEGAEAAGLGAARQAAERPRRELEGGGALRCPNPPVAERADCGGVHDAADPHAYPAHLLREAAPAVERGGRLHADEAVGERARVQLLAGKAAPVAERAHAAREEHTAGGGHSHAPCLRVPPPRPHRHRDARPQPAGGDAPCRAAARAQRVPDAQHLLHVAHLHLHHGEAPGEVCLRRAVRAPAVERKRERVGGEAARHPLERTRRVEGLVAMEAPRVERSHRV